MWRGFLEGWVGVRAGVTGSPPNGQSEAGLRGEFGRLLAWMSNETLQVRGFPGHQALLNELVGLYARASGRAQGLVRADMAAVLAHPSDPAFPHVLSLAGQVALPEARRALLHYLTEPHAAPSSAALLRPGRDERVAIDVRALVVRALGRMADPAFRSIFTTLIERHAEPALWDSRSQQILHQAGWALCRLDPQAFVDELPRSLQRDFCFLVDISNSSAIRTVINQWLTTLPPAESALLRTAIATQGDWNGCLPDRGRRDDRATFDR